MTIRTEPEKSPIEQATEELQRRLDATAGHMAKKYKIDEQKFRRVLALYFRRKTLRNWMNDLNVIALTTHNADR